MSTLDPRAIALQGVGFGPVAFAAQGLVLLELEQEASPVYGNGRKLRQTDAEVDIERLVREKWEAIEAAALARHVKETPVSSTDAPSHVQTAPEIAHEPEAHGISLALPDALRPRVLPSASAIAPRPLLPDQAERARLARQRDDEEALLMLLAEL